MNPQHRNLGPSEAAAHLGVSTKALRLYEQRGMISPGRSAAGWRLYSPEDLDRITEILSLRRLGLSLMQVARALDGDPHALDSGLAAHEDQLRLQLSQTETALMKLRRLRDDLRQGISPSASALQSALGQDSNPTVGFELPWPWGGEWFELRDIRALNFITGPLGSGKTRFAQRLAAELPGGVFVRLDRVITDIACDEDAAFAARVHNTLCWLEEEGATITDALRALVMALEADASAILVIDMVEEGLCDATQRALIARLRVRTRQKRRLFLMTRSSAILDLDLVGPEEAVIICPANHSPPFRVDIHPGGHGYEAAATCLATPEVRARTSSIIAINGRN